MTGENNMKNNDLPSFYKDKRVFITGITGDTGTWLALKLKSMGAMVCGIGLIPDMNSTAYKQRIHEKVDVIYGDITEDANQSSYLAALVEYNPEIVFHLAAQTPNWDDYSDVFSVFNTNIMGTVITHEILRGFDSKVSLVNVREEIPSSEGVEQFSSVVSTAITECYRGNIPSKVISSSIVRPTGDFSGEEGKVLSKSTVKKSLEVAMSQYIDNSTCGIFFVE